jgi:hypothetical protein
MIETKTANGKSFEGKGVVRFVTKKGAPVTMDASNRPVGLAQGMPDVNRAAKGVDGGAKAAFNTGKNINRSSVYTNNNS